MLVQSSRYVKKFPHDDASHSRSPPPRTRQPSVTPSRKNFLFVAA